MKPECTLEVTEIAEGVLHVEAETQYELASTFMRVQEFYESPYGEIRGHFFTHERYMDICAYGEKRSAQDQVVFSYLEDWNGFNVPGKVFDKWARLFKEHYLWDKEKELIKRINEKATTSAYYVIGTHKEGAHNDFDHELSHAWYYLDSKYKQKQHKNLNKLSSKVREQLKDHIMGDGYTLEVVEDETIAYLATNTMTETKDMMNKVRVPWTTVYKFQKTFVDFKEEKLDDDS